MAKYNHRYELAEEILSRGGSDAEVERRTLEEFPVSRHNAQRAQWYRRSWRKYGHCRGDKTAKNPSVQGDEEAAAIEEAWLDYSWSVLTDAEHIRQCESNGGSGIEDKSLRWPGFLGERYRTGGVVLIANIHRDFASGRSGHELADRLVQITRTWRATGRSQLSDAAYISGNRACYSAGLRLWTVGGWFAKFLKGAGLQFEDVTYLNAARCQSETGACQALQRLCLHRFPIKTLETFLKPSLMLTCSTVVRDEVRLDAPVRWFNQRNGTDQHGSAFDKWLPAVLEELQNADGSR